MTIRVRQRAKVSNLRTRYLVEVSSRLTPILLVAQGKREAQCSVF